MMLSIIACFLAHGEIRNNVPFQIWDLSIPSEWAPSKLSENQKIVEFGPRTLVTEPTLNEGTYMYMYLLV